MTEVPEHLLQRSRERREALGLATSEGGAATPAAPAASEGSAAPAVAEGAPAPAVAAAAPAAPAPVPAFKRHSEETYRKLEATRRSGVPLWVMPVLVALPFWGILYFGAFGNRKSEAAAPPNGAAIYSAKGCSGCHGAAGEGGSGPKLTGGEAKLTFPDEADHIQWVKTGSSPFAGQPYGAEDREGGQHVAKGNMPAFAGTLTDAEIVAVVQYEREQL